jgi:photosystem II stability/assembly factor-like uncharacterized protein
MKRTFTLLLVAIALMSTNSLIIFRVPAQTVEGSAGERVVLFVTNQPSALRGGTQAQQPSDESIAVLQLPQASSWSQQTSGTTNELRSVHFINENEGWAAGANVTLLHTTDGGGTWSPVTNTGVDPPNGFNAVRMIDQNTVWAGGRAAAIRSTNGGRNWGGVQWTAATGIPFQNSLFPASAETGWGVGPGPRTHLRHRLTSSFNFTTVFNEVSPEMNDVYFVNSNQGWSVGNSGQIFRIASDTLSVQTSGTTQTLNGIHMLDVNTGWVVGNGGTVLKTTNGGDTWTLQPGGITTNLQDVHFVDANRGWAVGDGGTILTSSDGGSSWMPDPSGVTAGLRSVFFANPESGWAAGADGTILKMGVSGPDFALGFDSATVNGVRGTKVKIVVTITRIGGFTGDITVTPPDPSAEGIVAKFPEPITSSDSTAAWKFKIKTPAATGPHQLTFTGRDGSGRVRTATVTLMIQ